MHSAAVSGTWLTEGAVAVLAGYSCITHTHFTLSGTCEVLERETVILLIVHALTSAVLCLDVHVDPLPCL